MGKQVPLVIYRGGLRTVIGRASVSDDGSIQAQVERDLWPDVKEYFLPGIGELSVSPDRPRVIIENT